MDLIFRHINLVRMEKEIMNEKYLIKGVCVSVAYIIYLSLCALVTTDERLLALIHILTLVLIFVASKRYITFEKTGIKLIAMSIVLGIGMALSFTVIVPFANRRSTELLDAGDFLLCEFYISIANNGGIHF